MKYWLSLSDDEQERRFEERINNPGKRWKLSPMDLEARAHWVDYAEAKDEMFSFTDIKEAPWNVVDADNKKEARLNLISHLLEQVPYKDVPHQAFELPPVRSARTCARRSTARRGCRSEIRRGVAAQEGKRARGAAHSGVFGATTSTVPCAAHTRRPSFSTSMRTTAVRLVSEMISARASRTPVVTAAR